MEHVQVLSVAFLGAVFLIATLYASVGHAGATGYIAVMTLAGLGPDVVRPTALSLNVVVAAIATAQFVRAGHFRAGLFVPLAVASVPCAALGGGMRLPTADFEAVLGGVLLLSSVRMVRETLLHRNGDDGSAAQSVWEPGGKSGVQADSTVAHRSVQRVGTLWMAALGAGVGMLSGLTGVGGGVFLTPLLARLEVAALKQIAAVTAPFIFVNSLAGLLGGLVASRPIPPLSWWLIAVAAVGGAFGSQLGAFRLPVPAIRLLMAAVLLVASVKLLAPLFGG